MIYFKYYFEKDIKLIVGSGGTYQKGFISSDVDWLDITNWWHWRRAFKPNSISVVLAEHVLEHLTEKQIYNASRNIHQFLKYGGVFRLAIPDKNRKDQKYVNAVKPPKDGHLSFLNVDEISDILKSVGFKVKPLEYYDEKGEFHKTEWSTKNGIVRRSVKADKQKIFWNGKHYYTSLIIDAIKL
jgi:predicted SAM-dependent methyltransferase